MFFILPGILVVGFAALAVWWLFLRDAIRHERTVREAREREADFERLLLTLGEPLYCVSCQEVFRGPLDDLGCPRCGVRAFVIPARASNESGVAERARHLPLSQPMENHLEEKATFEASVAAPDSAAAGEKIPQRNKRI